MSKDIVHSDKGWIGFDLDGTLAHYDKWRGVSHIGKPIKEMVDLARHLIKNGYCVKIVTARVCRQQKEADTIISRAVIEAWCTQHLGKRLEVTSEKDFNMIMLYDDRCQQVEHNTGKTADLRYALLYADHIRLKRTFTELLCELERHRHVGSNNTII